MGTSHGFRGETETLDKMKARVEYYMIDTIWLTILCAGIAPTPTPLPEGEGIHVYQYLVGLISTCKFGYR